MSVMQEVFVYGITSRAWALLMKRKRKELSVRIVEMNIGLKTLSQSSALHLAV